MSKKVVKTKTAAKTKKTSKTRSPKKTRVKKKVSQVTKKPKKTAKKTAIKKTTVKKAPAKKTVPSKVKSKAIKPTVTKSRAIKKPAQKIVIPKAKKSKKVAKVQIIPKKQGAKIPEAMQSADVTVVSQMLGMSGLEPYQPKKAEEYMSENMQAHFRKILQAWKHQLMEEVDRTVHHMKDEAANFPDPSDRATQEEEFNLELRARDRERKLIKKIDDSLRMIAEGSYGFCEACGVEIGLRRLEARPTATLCVDCKTLDEIREKQQGS